MTSFGVASALPFRFLVIIVLATSTWAQLSGVGTKTEKTCAGIKLDDRVTGCTGQDWYYSKAKPRVTAKTAIPVKMLQGRGGVPTTCDMLVPASWVMEVFMDNTVCDEMLQVTTRVLSKVESTLKSQFNVASNKQNLQRARILDIKKAIFKGDMVKTRRYGELERAATFDYLIRQKAAALAVGTKIDASVKSSLKVPGGVAAALGELYKKIQAENTILQASIAQKVRKLQQQAKQAQTNAANCGKAPGGKKLQARGLSSTLSRPRLVRSFNIIGSHPTSLERAATAAGPPRSGPRAPPAPSCPVKGAPPKKTIPRSQVKTKPPPATKPRVPKTRPNPKPRSPAKKTAPRPATRPRRAPGKPAARRRTTPKTKPKPVPRPTRRPKGKARSRRGRRK